MKKGGSESRASSAASGRQNLPCKFYQTGNCNDAQCRFPHENATEEQKKQLAKLRPRSGSPGGNRGKCYEWLNKGHCSWHAEGKCRYDHDEADKGRNMRPAAPATAEAKAKAKAKAKK